MTEADMVARRELLYGLLGDLPPRDMPIDALTVKRVSGPKYDVETLVLSVNGVEPVPAYFLRPASAGSDPLSVVVYNHGHGNNFDLGKEELLTGHPMKQKPPFGEALTAAGYAVMCIDHWSFGDRRGRTESSLFRESLWKGRVLWGMMVYDSLRTVDYLVTRPDVDPSRIATLGKSMGSTMAWWLAALDPRIKVCVDLNCMTDFETLIETQGLDGHAIYYFVPGLLKHFSTSDINALIAPRPHLSLAGDFDPLTPPAGLERVNAAMKVAYAAAGAPGAWQMRRYLVGHIETAAMRAEVMSFLAKWL